jgi:hypothetical protein
MEVIPKISRSQHKVRYLRLYYNKNNYKGVIRIRQSKDNTMANRKRTEGETTAYKTLHRKLKIEQQEPH